MACVPLHTQRHTQKPRAHTHIIHIHTHRAKEQRGLLMLAPPFPSLSFPFNFSAASFSQRSAPPATPALLARPWPGAPRPGRGRRGCPASRCRPRPRCQTPAPTPHQSRCPPLQRAPAWITGRRTRTRAAQAEGKGGREGEKEKRKTNHREEGQSGSGPNNAL